MACLHYTGLLTHGSSWLFSNHHRCLTLNHFATRDPRPWPVWLLAMTAPPTRLYNVILTYDAVASISIHLKFISLHLYFNSDPQSAFCCKFYFLPKLADLPTVLGVLLQPIDSFGVPPQSTGSLHVLPQTLTLHGGVLLLRMDIHRIPPQTIYFLGILPHFWNICIRLGIKPFSLPASRQIFCPPCPTTISSLTSVEPYSTLLQLTLFRLTPSSLASSKRSFASKVTMWSPLRYLLIPFHFL